jgi:hypothetical protein
MELTRKDFYESPVVEVTVIQSEGVVCQSAVYTTQEGNQVSVESEAIESEDISEGKHSVNPV